MLLKKSSATRIAAGEVSPEADRDIIATEHTEATENLKLVTPLRPQGENGVCDVGVVDI
ncbi:MAG: hypothetical protein WBL85_01290 [Sedimentisphaerales bacterium]